MAFLYVFLGGSRDGETMTSAEHAISTFTTREGRYFVDDPPKQVVTPAGPALVLRYVHGRLGPMPAPV